MLKGISPMISPDMLSALCRMGHGDEVVVGDGHFPAETFASHCVVRADGLSVVQILNAILPLFELDSYVESPIVTMEAVPGDTLNPEVEAAYRRTADQHGYASAKMSRLERFAFYERAKGAFLIIQTGDTAKYANVILKKGVTPCS